jgi:biotin carboxyl carrier protein
MKMENEIKSPVAGRITEILVRGQMTVEKGAPLLHITN